MYHIYQIASNDTLDSIANYFQTTVEQLKKINGIQGNVMLKQGGFLIVPTPNHLYLKTYIVNKGDTIHKIAKEQNIDYNMLLKLNGLDEQDYIYPNQEILIPTENIKIYQIKQGDSIASVKSITGLDIDQIKTPSGQIYLEKDQIIFY